jgi:Transposase DDE domain
VISDPIDTRRVDKLEPKQQRAVRAARRSTKSKSGKEMLRRRGMHIERSFAHILDCGGMRRTTLRGWENLNKRFKLAATLERRGRKLLWRLAEVIIQLTAVADGITSPWHCAWREFREVFRDGQKSEPSENGIISTNC